MKKAVIGMGNPLKMDDNLGNLIASRLELPKENFLVIEAGQMPSNFIGTVEKFGPDVIYFVDVAFFDAEAGDVKLFPIDAASEANASTHSLPITFFKGFFPKTKLSLIGIQPKRIDYGEELTPEMEKKLPEIVDKVRKLLLAPVPLVGD